MLAANRLGKVEKLKYKKSPSQKERLITLTMLTLYSQAKK